MSCPNLDLTPDGMNTSNAKISPLESTTVTAKTRFKTTNTTNGIVKTKIKRAQEYVPEDVDSELSFSDSSPSESDSFDDRKYSKSKGKRQNKNKTLKGHKTGLVRLIDEQI